MCPQNNKKSVSLVMLETLEIEQTVQAKRQAENSTVITVIVHAEFWMQYNVQRPKQLKHMSHQNSLS